MPKPIPTQSDMYVYTVVPTACRRATLEEGGGGDR